MIDRELDAFVAEKVMGLTVAGVEPIEYWPDGTVSVCYDAEPSPNTVMSPVCVCRWCELSRARERPSDNWPQSEAQQAFWSRTGFDPHSLEPVPHYSADPAADYEVLRRVREQFGMDGEIVKHKDYCWALMEQQSGHCRVCFGWKLRPEYAVCYEVGDYTRAAYAVLTGDKAHE